MPRKLTPEERSELIINQIDPVLPYPPKTMLDIGCGSAFISEAFQQKYGTDLWLLDGDSSVTQHNTRNSKYDVVDNMRFYDTVINLKEKWDNKNLQYTFVDASNIQLGDLKFDLITSFLSCGFHYPLDTYLEIFHKHSHDDTVIIVDIRKKTNQLQKFDVIEVIETTSKRQKLQIRPK